MKIGIDLRALEGGIQHRGIGRYATQLIEALSEIDKNNEYIFFISDPSVEAPTFKLSQGFSSSIKTGKKAWTRKAKFVRTMYLRQNPLHVDRYDLDVFFHIDIQQPIIAKKTPVVSVLYDLIPFIYKDTYQYIHFGGFNPGNIVFYIRLKLMWMLAEKSLQDYHKAAGVVSISEYSKNDLAKFLPGVDSSKIHAIPLAASPVSDVLPKPSKSLQKMEGLDYIFYVGGADPRKGLVGFVADMEAVWVKHPNTHLILAGKEVVDKEVPEAARLHEAVKASSKPKQIHLLGFISDEELAWLYSHAVAFVFPSRYEGFGLPVLEAMQAGCPVVAYSNSSVPEVAGDAALLVSDGKPLAPSINELIGGLVLRKSMINKGYKQAAKFTWQKTAKKTLQVLEAAGATKK